jgi:hypothetical protein
MITMLCSLVLGTISFQPEQTAYPAYIPLYTGVYAFTTDAGGWWRRSFVAQQDGTVYVYVNQPEIPVYSNVDIGTNCRYLSTYADVLGINQQLVEFQPLFGAPDFFTTVSKLDSFTLRVHDEPYTEFAVVMNPEPATICFLITGIILSRKYGRNK